MLMFLILVTLMLIMMVVSVYKQHFRQKTRSPQQRRMYVGSRARPSLAQQEPSIFVSPSNLPPPPKYECMAPPSYEEVVGVHYPNYQVQPITTPITSALAQTSANSAAETRTTETRSNDTGTVTRTADETIVTVPRTASS
ncbi:hypothetical protein PYW08_009929 [Mythimna loreyi]|uniref:Uncharacterized protein n=1 Tax=Mythimna loreyi TaxID=667449 RepID=A0ACC2Q5S3_9NEOP|nr:hypothetical protein PYW08_009929 [Mythimna loreyi]